MSRYVPGNIKLYVSVPPEAAARAVAMWHDPETDEEQTEHELMVKHEGWFDVSAAPERGEGMIAIWQENRMRLGFEVPDWWVTVCGGQVRQYALSGGLYDIVFTTRAGAEAETAKFKHIRRKADRVTVEMRPASDFINKTIVRDGKLVTIAGVISDVM